MPHVGFGPTASGAPFRDHRLYLGAGAIAVPYGNATPAAPVARNLSNYYGTGETVLFVNRSLKWGGSIATRLSVLSIVPRHCAQLTDFLHPKLRKINAVLITPHLMSVPCGACGAQEAFPIPDHRSTMVAPLQHHSGIAHQQCACGAHARPTLLVDGGVGGWGVLLCFCPSAGPL